MSEKRFMSIVACLAALAMLVGSCGGGAPEATAQPAGTSEPIGEATQAGPAGCPASTVADPAGVPPGEFRQQYEIDEYERLANCVLTFRESPMLAEQVAAGTLPPVDERLPAEPLVVQPYEEIGVYGGTMRGMSIAVGSATTDFMSWRHVNLLRFSDDLITVVPDVARSWEWITDDFTVLEIQLRQGHRWSDGEPFTADDILFWWEDIINNEELTPTVPSMYVFGGEPMRVEKVDEVTVRFSFAAPAPNILVLFARNPWPPFSPRHFMMEYHATYNPQAQANAEAEGFTNWTDRFYSLWNQWSSIYGMGVPHLESYILVERDTEHRHYVRNPYYFKVDTTGQQLPYIDEENERFIADTEVRNLAFMNGEIDLRGQNMNMSVYPLLMENEERGNYQLRTVPSEYTMALGWNLTSRDPVLRQIFNDIRWKEATSIAINRDEINTAIYMGVGRPMQFIPVVSTLPWVEESWLTRWIEYDPERANQLLDEMGLTTGSDGWRMRPDGQVLTIYLQFTQMMGPVRIFELLEEYWEAVGIRVETRELSTEALRSLTSNNEHDIAGWEESGGTMPVYLAVNTIPIAPVFGDRALAAYSGLPWLEWAESGGTAGEEPPDDIRQLQEYAAQWPSLLMGSPEWIEMGTDICEMFSENMYKFGLIGDVPVPYLVHNRLHNVPMYTANSYTYYWHFPYRVDQFFIREE